jgi:hypothetical protein
MADVIYRGYYIRNESNTHVVRKNEGGPELHRADTQREAMGWVDAKRREELAKQTDSR